MICFFVEVSILVGLSHPNLITYYFTAKHDTSKYIELYLEIKLMQKSLDVILEEDK